MTATEVDEKLDPSIPYQPIFLYIIFIGMSEPEN